MKFKTYPPAEGYTAEQIRKGHHWIDTDVTCPHCGKVQPMAATQYFGGTCVECGGLTGVTHREEVGR